MATHELYPFRFFDPIRGRWIRARYVATLETIRARYPQFELAGPPEIRETGDLYDDATSRIVSLSPGPSTTGIR